MVIRCCTNTASAKHNIPACEALFQSGSDLLRIVGNIFCPGKTQATLVEQLNHFAHVFVLTATRQNLIANHN